MKADEIVVLLQKYNYSYIQKNEILTVSLDFSQNVIIDLTNVDKVIISDQLVSWNFLTGGIKMSLKNALIYNFILMFIFGFLCQYVMFLDQNFVNFFLVFISWILLFSTFYLIKFESFRRQVVDWTS